MRGKQTPHSDFHQAAPARPCKSLRRQAKDHFKRFGAAAAQVIAAERQQAPNAGYAPARG